jgi:predicted ribosomally synthesized peptide with SipW-like signal peptide
MKTRVTKLAITGAWIAGAVALTTSGTLALFSDQDAIGANTFSTGGTISLTTSPTSALVTFGNMMPGDTVTNPLVVTNAGGESLRYAVSSVATNTDTPTPKGLKDQLVLTVKTVDTTTPVTPCNEFDGTYTLYTGDLDAAAGLILGSAISGQTGVATTGGDRTLASAANETLCFRVKLPRATGNAFQDATTTATFTFDSEQTKNN